LKLTAVLNTEVTEFTEKKKTEEKQERNRKTGQKKTKENRERRAAEEKQAERRRQFAGSAMRRSGHDYFDEAAFHARGD
jgi:hypothetical protein